MSIKKCIVYYNDLFYNIYETLKIKFKLTKMALCPVMTSRV